MNENVKSNVAISESRIGMDAPLVVSNIFDNCLYSGFFGRLDSERMKKLTDRIIQIIEDRDVDIIIIDLSNIELIDSAIAVQLTKLGITLKLTGVNTIFCGIKGIVAQTMSVLGVEFEKFDITKDLKKALDIVYKINGYKLVRTTN